MNDYSIILAYSQSVAKARSDGQPIVALESAVITHGLPYPHNQNLAMELESLVQSEGAVPATIAVLDGKIQVGISASQLQTLANSKDAIKISRRDFGMALARGLPGGTTVAGTLFAAHRAGIRVFATGGIGGVHRNAPFDMSADLVELGRTPLIVVCAGAKSILDLPATLEVLETQGVMVIGYRTNDFPAFYARSSGLTVPYRSDSPQDIAAIAQAHWNAGILSSILVVNPLPEEAALPYEEIEAVIQAALKECGDNGVQGSAVTPFLLSRVKDLSGGKSLTANLALLRSNARLAAQIAVAVQQPNQNRMI